MNRSLPYLFGSVFNTPLLINPAKLDAFMVTLPAMFTRGSFAFDKDDDDDAIAQRRPSGYTIANGVATLPIHGVLVRRAGQIDATTSDPLQSYETINRSFQAAQSDARVRAILLDIDSPGGESGMVMDLARNIRATQRKPVWAIANDDGFSAAYAIASAADRIWTTRTGGVGSIGTVALHTDQSAYDEKEGLRYNYIASSKRKTDANSHQPLSPEARAVIQGEVDRLQGMFVDLVAQHRGLPHDQIRAQEAGLYFGHDAIHARLADQIGTAGDAHGALAAQVATARGRTAAMAESIEVVADADPPAPVVEDNTVISLGAARQQGADRAVEIMELCIAANRAPLGTQLARSDMTTDQVRRHLMDLAAAEVAAPVVPVQTAETVTPGPAMPKPITSAESFAVMRRRN
jgi:signal peptide peptidase SppA